MGDRGNKMFGDFPEAYQYKAPDNCDEGDMFYNHTNIKTIATIPSQDKF